MSIWATLEARFTGDLVNEDVIREGVPRGSEDGARVRVFEGVVYVDGRLRDFRDIDSPAALAWFVSNAQWADEADLLLEIDGGPRYRYEWRDHQLRKIKGILDA